MPCLVPPTRKEWTRSIASHTAQFANTGARCRSRSHRPIFYTGAVCESSDTRAPRSRPAPPRAVIDETAWSTDSRPRAPASTGGSSRESELRGAGTQARASCAGTGACNGSERASSGTPVARRRPSAASRGALDEPHQRADHALQIRRAAASSGFMCPNASATSKHASTSRAEPSATWYFAPPRAPRAGGAPRQNRAREQAQEPRAAHPLPPLNSSPAPPHSPSLSHCTLRSFVTNDERARSPETRDGLF